VKRPANKNANSMLGRESKQANQTLNSAYDASLSLAEQRAKAALHFLQCLDSRPEATFNIEHYTDLPKGQPKTKHDPLRGRYANLSLADVEQLLPRLNKINEQGAGIFVARNQCDGHRNEQNVSRVRGAHADMDDVTPAQIEAVIRALEPSIIVQSSSKNRCQLYWQLADGEELTKDEAKLINQCLVQHYGADPAAVDVSRLLRLPGFMHMKYRADGRTPTVTLTGVGETYTAAQIRNTFPPAKGTTQTPKAPPPSNSSGEVHQIPTPAPLETVVKAVSEKYPSLWAGEWEKVVRPSGEIGYSSKSEADLALCGHIARACIYQGVPEYELAGAAETVFSSSGLGADNKWQSRGDYRERTITKAIASLSNHPATQSTLQLESYGDIRNAKAFAQSSRGQFLFVATRESWLKWQQEQWHLCDKEEHVSAAKDVCNQILNAASAVFRENQEIGKKLLQDAMTAHNLPRIMAMLKLAVSEPEMATTDKELDSDPYKLGVGNGVVDLRSGLRYFNQPELKVTRYCNADFVEDAPYPRWIAFLNQIFQEDEETIESVQRLLGYTLTGLVTEEVLVICYGHGSNGKSVFSNVIHSIFGGYATTSPPSLLTARKADDTSPRNDLAALAGARYVSINELQAGDRLDEQVVKMLAGREPISARFLHREYFEYMPNFTAWLRTNHKPIIIGGGDDGIWRRLVLLPFRRKFADDEKDPFLESKLLEERDGILQWMLEGTRKYLKDGLKLSPRIRQENATYRKDSDLIGEFLDDVMEVDPTAKINQQTAYEAWQEWCRDNGFRITSKKSFTQRLAERGYPEGKSGAARFYVGLKTQVKKNLPTPTPTQDGVDRISAVFPNSKNIDSHMGKTVNSEHPAQLAHGGVGA
jgi:P4 family phage/plasmid primase-like protien